MNNIPDRLEFWKDAKTYKVTVDTARKAWWSAVLPAPYFWLSKLFGKDRRSTEVVFARDPRLHFDHVIVIPASELDKEPQLGTEKG